MKQALFIISIFIAIQSIAQQSDFILFKKKDRTIATYFTGTDIKFTDVSGAYIEGTITAIRNDSIFLKEYVIRQLPTQLGVYILDTTYYYYQNHYNQIKAIAKAGRHFDWGASGSVLMGGGILLAVASGVIYFADNSKFSPELLIAGVGLTGVGYLLIKSSGKGMVIGKKYSLVYIKAADNKKG
jgi:hypothetical protein